MPLRAVDCEAWPSEFKKYLDWLQCPLPPSTPPGSIISWLLGTAVRLEFAEKPDKFNKKQKVEDFNGKAGDGFSGPEFDAGVAALAELLKVLASMNLLCSLTSNNLATL